MPLRADGTHAQNWLRLGPEAHIHDVRAQKEENWKIRASLGYIARLFVCMYLCIYLCVCLCIHTHTHTLKTDWNVYFKLRDSSFLLCGRQRSESAWHYKVWNLSLVSDCEDQIPLKKTSAQTWCSLTDTSYMLLPLTTPRVTPTQPCRLQTSQFQMSFQIVMCIQLLDPIVHMLYHSPLKASRGLPLTEDTYHSRASPLILISDDLLH